MNKSELLTNINNGRASLEFCLSRIPDEKMDLIILHGEWSVKDMIGHLGFWEDRICKLFGLLKKGNSPDPNEDLDLINQQSIKDLRKIALSEIIEFEKSAFHNLRAIAENANDEELFSANYFSWTEGRPFAEIILDDTTGHYEEHIPEITAWEKRIA